MSRGRHPTTIAYSFSGGNLFQSRAGSTIAHWVGLGHSLTDALAGLLASELRSPWPKTSESITLQKSAPRSTNIPAVKMQRIASYYYTREKEGAEGMEELSETR